MESQSSSEIPGESDLNQTTPGKSIWQILVGVFSSPSTAFAAFDRKPQIVIPLIIVLLLGGISGGMMAPYMSRAQHDMLQQSTIIPADQLAKMDKPPNPAFSGFMGAVGVLFIGLVYTLLIWPFGNFVFGGQARFLKLWGVTLLGGIIAQVGNLLKLPLMIAKDSAYVSYGLAALLPGKDFTSLTYSFLYYLDGFAIWSLIVSGIGYAIVYKFSHGKGILMSFVVNMLIVIVMLVLTSVGMGLAGVKINLF
jgi:hypothetical protein